MEPVDSMVSFPPNPGLSESTKRKSGGLFLLGRLDFLPPRRHGEKKRPARSTGLFSICLTVFQGSYPSIMTEGEPQFPARIHRGDALCSSPCTRSPNTNAREPSTTRCPPRAASAPRTTRRRGGRNPPTPKCTWRRSSASDRQPGRSPGLAPPEPLRRHDKAVQP